MNVETVINKNEQIPFSAGAFCALIHNGQLIKKAERIISEFASAEGTFIYLQNPDGTTIRIQGGCKLISAEYKLLISNQID